ncbi:hypothetical protein MPTK1_1g13520 [Marchantia polymorpha subsp. ruderalis]|uniref:Uncharacterized protein n=2 Tax=Marchantia polymorpha TaxID=3197 RepID=A0AAF6APR5_MARPO|nr:hypothetical protein MARPO_0019s0122 [Marchantia polymorpha]BBM98435.1 hypothetical protein Mp_1g13520 [Marchantia polymorpha subsp. ruderalis]|eukprot:PTQ44705.1 hypothetical protein MARPO_0019s0122 [Marchantia polymorpha]
MGYLIGTVCQILKCSVLSSAPHARQLLLARLIVREEQRLWPFSRIDKIATSLSKHLEELSLPCVNASVHFMDGSSSMSLRWLCTLVQLVTFISPRPPIGRLTPTVRSFDVFAQCCHFSGPFPCPRERLVTSLIAKSRTCAISCRFERANLSGAQLIFQSMMYALETRERVGGWRWQFCITGRYRPTTAYTSGRYGTSRRLGHEPRIDSAVHKMASVTELPLLVKSCNLEDAGEGRYGFVCEIED